VRVAVVASAQIFGGFQNLPPLQSLDFPAFFGLSHLFPPRLSISVIFDTDLVTSQKKRENYSLVQRLIKQNWPNATALKNIRSHKEDVPRKLLLLLYVITEDSTVVSGGLLEVPETELTMQERIEEHWWTLNAMLADCGMALLDPRNINDWLILYAIGAAGEEESMSERLEQVIALMYQDL